MERYRPGEEDEKKFPFYKPLRKMYIAAQKNSSRLREFALLERGGQDAGSRNLGPIVSRNSVHNLHCNLKKNAVPLSVDMAVLFFNGQYNKHF